MQRLSGTGERAAFTWDRQEGSVYLGQVRGQRLSGTGERAAFI